MVRNLADPDLEDRAEAYHGSSCHRLVRVKARHDPSNLFRVQQALPSRP